MSGGGSDSALLTLQLYLDAGGNVVNEEGQPVLEIEPLIEALQHLEQGRESGFIIPQSSTITTEDQAWQVFLSGGASIVRTSSDHFLGEVTTGLPIEYTVTPGIDRSLTPLVSGWAWAVSTSDERRSDLALALVRHMVSGDNLAVWTQESDVLPSRQDALAGWTRDISYVNFIEQELDRARAMPVGESSKLLTVLGDAAFQVLSGTEGAQTAAEEALIAFES
jgi:ABC-type glycerol-3-phosphate transport system substrate-binding protein